MQLVDLVGVEEGAREVRTALEQDRGDRLRAELGERRAHARRLVLTRGHDHLGALADERARRRARRRARDHHGEWELPGRHHELGVQRQAGERVEDDPARLPRDALDAGRELRVIGERGADADGHRVALGAPAVRAGAAGLAGDPLRLAALGGHLAVQGSRGLQADVGPAGAGVLAKRLVEQPCALGQLALGQLDCNPVVAQDARAAAGSVLGGIVGADDHARDARGGDRLRARGRLALVAAGLERHVHRRAAQVRVACGGDRGRLGVRTAVVRMVALADHLPVSHEHGADERVRAHPTTSALRQLDCASQVQSVGVGTGRHRGRTSG